MNKKKNNNEGIISKLRLIIKSGKLTIGFKTTIRSLKDGKCKLVIVANNCPPTRRLEIEYYALLLKASVHRFYGSNSELGVVCGKIFNCSCLGIIDLGDADIDTISD
jgi:large subunit ribosomal protein L30e|mmetsp:Transcript_11128/g.27011  ORF Transcript_11128/g.27011 Transcript_11128/m.27011 type:complete len:107 (+) Transcript_11128:70-390(+)